MFSSLGSGTHVTVGRCFPACVGITVGPPCFEVTDVV